MRKEGIDKRVVLVKCKDYDPQRLDRALEKALKLIKFDPKNNTNVLIKPNLVMISDNKKKQIAISTNINLIRAVCKFLKKNKCKIYIGESSFMATDKVMNQLGITKLAKEYCHNKRPIIFEQEKFSYIKDKKARILKRFPVARIIKKMDYIINMPKMKTHMLTDVTLGVKNLYGLIPGGLKQKLHNKAHEEKFSELLVDIYQNFPCELTVMDAITGMEGNGPTSGDKKQVGLLLTSRNAIALDIAASRIMGFKPEEIISTRIAVKRRLYPDYSFELLGLKKLPIKKFKKAKPSMKDKKEMKAIFSERKIICNEELCIRCQKCKRACPTRSITMRPFPKINSKTCVRCFCCLEICPRDALGLRG